MALSNSTRKAGGAVALVIDDLGCLGEDYEPKRRYTSPKSPTNLRYARSHAELAGRSAPALTEGVSFTEELECEDYCNWE
jgi:hypothetical protein